MKKCVKCEVEFETPGVQCQKCRDRVTQKVRVPNYNLLDPILLTAILRSKLRREKNEMA